MRTVRRHLASAEGAHLFCPRPACRRAGACHQDEACVSTIHGPPDAMPPDMELMALRLAYLLRLASHWDQLPARRSRRTRAAVGAGRKGAGRNGTRAKSSPGR